ncbi:MAG: hypothetical protein KA885_04925 [Spirochaetes bacterium]|nr:hypothetical protein [Spirochaetota bacterium]
MKTNHFAKLFFFPVVLILLFTAFSCDPAIYPSDYPNGDYFSTTTYASTTTTLPVDASKSLSFNNRNGKAVASIDPASDNHLYRATTPVAATLAKILEDGTLESFFILEGDATVDSWPEVDFFIKSPTNEIYINFNTELVIKVNKEIIEEIGNMTQTYTVTVTCKVGSFICIKEDGTFVDILKNDWGSWAHLNTFSDTNPVVFDQIGNMYYILSESSSIGPMITNAIYKFDPKTGASTIMTEKKEEIWYKKFLISKDGRYLFAETCQMINGVLSANLRAIPVNSPTNYKDIFSVSDISQGFVTSFTVSDDNTVYYSGDGLGADMLYGIFSAKESDYTKSTHDIHNLFNTMFSYLSIFDASDDPETTPIEMYWKKTGFVKFNQVPFINVDGSINSKNILDSLREYIPYPNQTFSLTTLKTKCGLQLDDTLVNEEAITALDFDNIQLLFEKYFGTDGFGNNQFLIDAFGLSENDLNLSIKYSSQLNGASDGSIWGITLGGACQNPENTWKESFIRLYDKDGNPSVYAPPALKDGAFLPIKLQMGEGYIYFNCLLSESSEYHTIKRMSLTDTETLIDVFVNVPDNTTIKISDYSISGDTLYFSGIKAGTTAISGKIDLTGQAFTYTEVAGGFKINKILAY